MDVKGSILYVDDETDNLEYFSHILQDDGFKVKTVNNSEEAYQQLGREQPDILLLDIGLQNESGFDILKKVKSDNQFAYMPVVMITGMYRASEDQSLGLELGADGYLTRPIHKREFLARINAFMRHKKTVAALEKSEHRFRRIIEKNPDAMLIVEKDGQIKFANKAAENLFQLAADVLLQRMFGYPLVAGEHAEVNIVRKTKDELIAEMRTVDIDWEDKDAFLTSMRDVTYKKKLWDELVNAKEKAEESDNLKSAFLANMSHEIRTPMNGILGFAELLKKPNLSGIEQQDYITVIEKSGQRMLNIINDIIDISKIESGQMETVLAETSIYEIMTFIYSFFNTQAEQKGIRLSFINQNQEDHPVINTDKEKLFAIFTNLIKNALKYCDTGHIEFGYKLKNKYIEFFVKDTGIGISKDRQKAIFDRFIQADIFDKRALQGAGLGLTISKAYVEMMGGKIWVESEPNKGSSFYFTIPFSELSKTGIKKAKTSVVSNGNEIKKLNIIIAEDDMASEMLLSVLVNPYAKKIIKVETGIEVIEACKNNPDTDLILMDIQMPEMSGYVATKEIRKFNSSVVIVAQTAYALKGDHERAIEAGCSDYIAKPINREDFEALLAKNFGS